MMIDETVIMAVSKVPWFQMAVIRLAHEGCSVRWVGCFINFHFPTEGSALSCVQRFATVAGNMWSLQLASDATCNKTAYADQLEL